MRSAGCAVALLLLTGCGSPDAGPLSLVLISPHRDEIRIETARAFGDWFAERTDTRLSAAKERLQAVQTQHAPDAVQRTEESLQSLFADWAPTDLGDLPRLRDAWKMDPSAENCRALLDGLGRWNGPRRRVECVWQDIGGGTSQIIRYVEARFGAEPSGIGVDLLFGGGTDPYLRFIDRAGGQPDLLQPLPELLPLIKDRIPAQLNGVPLYDPKGRWFGPMLSSFGILCNREVLRRIGDAEPRSWDALGRTSLRTWINAGDPRLTGSIHMVYEIILQGEGWDAGFRLLTRMGANTHTFIRDSGTLSRSVSIGEVAAAGSVDVQALGAVNRSPETMTFVLPAIHETRQADGKVTSSGGTIINPDAIAMLRGAPHPELARAFIEFTLSDAGQKLFLLRPGEPGGPRRYAVARLSPVQALYQEYPPEQRAVGAADPFTQKNALRYNDKLGKRRWDALNDLMGAVIVDAHDELAAAWQAVVEARLAADERQRLEEELFQPPCSEAELLQHAERIQTKGPRDREIQVNRWAEEARQRYRQVRRSAQSAVP
jgi:ABC-type Fe3+ transport system substrate-binding protein